jgi:hypothetical protein
MSFCKSCLSCQKEPYQKFKIDYHFMREIVAIKQLKIKFISNKNQMADDFIKIFARQKFRQVSVI